MQLKEFGFQCGVFSVALTAQKMIIPGSKGTLKRTLLPMVSDLNDAAGHYTLSARSEEETICDLPVHVQWAAPIPPKEPLPFLMLKTDEPRLIETLRLYEGKRVSLKFTIIGDGT